jgi:hypothetical protein
MVPLYTRIFPPPVAPPFENVRYWQKPPMTNAIAISSWRHREKTDI